MITRDALGIVCHQHGRIALAVDDQAEKLAAEHLQHEHHALWVALCSAEPVRAPSRGKWCRTECGRRVWNHDTGLCGQCDPATRARSTTGRAGAIASRAGGGGE